MRINLNIMSDIHLQDKEDMIFIFRFPLKIYVLLRYKWIGLIHVECMLTYGLYIHRVMQSSPQ